MGSKVNSVKNISDCLILFLSSDHQPNSKKVGSFFPLPFMHADLEGSRGALARVVIESLLSIADFDLRFISAMALPHRAMRLCPARMPDSDASLSKRRHLSFFFSFFHALFFSARRFEKPILRRPSIVKCLAVKGQPEMQCLYTQNVE